MWLQRWTFGGLVIISNSLVRLLIYINVFSVSSSLKHFFDTHFVHFKMGETNPNDSLKVVLSFKIKIHRYVKDYHIFYIPTHSKGIPDQVPSSIHRITRSPSSSISNPSAQTYEIRVPTSCPAPLGTEPSTVGTLGHLGSGNMKQKMCLVRDHAF